MNLVKLGLVWMVAVVGVAAYGAGCSEVKNAYDCNHICSRYSECFDTSYDVDTCESKCKDSANDNDAFANKADDCQSCEDDMSCAGATFNCGAQCIGIVP
jgi:hypothetical protein